MKKILFDILIGGIILGTILLIITILYLNRIVNSLEQDQNAYSIFTAKINNSSLQQTIKAEKLQQAKNSSDLQQTTGSTQNARNIQ